MDREQHNDEDGREVGAHDGAGHDNASRETTMPRWWPIVEVAIGGGLLTGIIGVAFGCIWYFAMQDATITRQGQDLAALSLKVDQLDNAVLASRITALEGTVGDLRRSNERTDDKLDDIKTMLLGGTLTRRGAGPGRSDDP